MPTRFKYTKVEPTDFNLTPAEIFTATDAELNAYVGLKRYAPYRKDRSWDAQRAARLKELRDKLKERGVRGPAEGAEKVKKRKGKKERMRAKAVVSAEDGGVGEETAETEPKERGKRKTEVEGQDEGQDEDGPEDGPVKKKRRRQKKNQTADAVL